MHLERKMIFQTSMIMFHVHLQGCIPNYLESLLVQDVVNQMCQLNDAITALHVTME